MSLNTDQHTPKRIRLKRALDRERFAHSLRVEKTALALAKKYGVNQRQTALAALLHDYARKFDRPGLLKEAKKRKLKVDQISRLEPKLLHAELSARLAQEEFGVKDRAVLAAIRKHTLGTPGMSRLEKIIFLADHIEEGRSHVGVAKVRTLAAKDLDQAIVATLSNTIHYLLGKKLPVHPDGLKTRNYYLLNK
jgi:predicted HD superfamily hydrolase involved in NAD metabolism